MVAGHAASSAWRPRWVPAVLLQDLDINSVLQRVGVRTGPLVRNAGALRILLRQKERPG